MDHKASRAFRVHKVNKAFRVCKDCRGHRVFQVQLDLRARLALADSVLMDRSGISKLRATQ